MPIRRIDTPEQLLEEISRFFRSNASVSRVDAAYTLRQLAKRINPPDVNSSEPLDPKPEAVPIDGLNRIHGMVKDQTKSIRELRNALFRRNKEDLKTSDTGKALIREMRDRRARYPNEPTLYETPLRELLQYELDCLLKGAWHTKKDTLAYIKLNYNVTADFKEAVDFKKNIDALWDQFETEWIEDHGGKSTLWDHLEKDATND